MFDRRRKREQRLLEEIGKPQALDDMGDHLDDPNWRPDDLGHGKSKYITSTMYERSK